MAAIRGDTRRSSGSPTLGSNRDTNRKGKIPIPVSVSLYNLFPGSKEAAEQKKSKKWFRPDHAMSLLHRVRLEIVIAPPPPTDQEIQEKEYGTYDKVVFSSEAGVKTVHPSWHHLDECIEDFLAIDGYYDSEKSLYRHMRLRIWLLDEKKYGEGLTEHDKGSSEAGEKPPEEERNPKRPLLDINIHPTKLSRLAKVPPKLPINSLILHFSDGSIRATRALLEIVGDQDGSHSDENLKDEFGRFGDDVFRTLDSVTPAKKRQPDSELFRKGDSNGPQALTETSLVLSNNEDSSGTAASPSLLNQKSGRLVSKYERDRLALKEKFMVSENDITSDDERAEQKHLEELIQAEEAELHNDIELLKQEKAELRLMMETAEICERKISTLEEDVQKEKQSCRHSEFYLEARRLKVLHDLRDIYPISILKTEGKYAIRDLRIPLDLHSGMVPEEELSAALGFLCHFVILTSRYLNVQLRYRVFFNSSRSAIQEHTSTVYPLFQARMVERDQLDYGMVLLQRNVECILGTQNIPFSPNDHVLVNAKRLFDVVVDGAS